MSINSELLTYSNHKFWLNTIIKDPYIDFFIGINEGFKIGVVRFNFDEINKFAELSININPNYRGKGLGKKLLLKSISKYLYKKQCLIKAKIKNNNERSIKLFLSIGFLIVEKTSELTFLEYVNKLNFKKVDNSSYDCLFKLLKDRKYNISHKEMPTFKKHKEFINSAPYEHWYIFSAGETILGSFYIKKDNSIGIHLNQPNINIVEKIIIFINKNFKPKKGIPSLIPNYFYVNIADNNDKMKSILKSIGLAPIQVSFKLSELKNKDD